MENEKCQDVESAFGDAGHSTCNRNPVAMAASQGNNLRLRPVDLVDVEVRNLSVHADGSKTPPWTSIPAALAWLGIAKGERTIKTLLNDVSTRMPSSSLTAIMGGSGSGKTTLLDVLAHRTQGTSLDQSGLVMFNGRDEQWKPIKAGGGIGVAYVMQQDILLPTLTVRETLQYGADLRLSSSTSKDERKLLVDDVIRDLGLGLCADTRIGDTSHSGCSGGEKRRTSIGLQLLANQSVLFLDEPTTGLDASSAFQLVQTLKNLARKGRTVIMTIHQPRSEIWSLLDSIILLTRGSLVYSGPVEECLPHFEQMGYPLPPFVNPGEFVVDLAAIDTRTPEQESLSVDRVNALQQAWMAKKAHVDVEAEEQTSLTDRPIRARREGVLPYISGFVREVHVLARRTWRVTCRDHLGLAASLAEALTMGIISGWIFLHLGADLAGIRSREGALYSAAALQGYLVLLFETYRLTVDIEVFDRERTESVVSAASFVCSRRIARFLLEDLPVPLLYSVLFYFMAGFRSDAGQFFYFFAVVLILHYIAVNLATVCVAISRNFLTASLIANLSFTLQTLACGFLVNSENVAIWLRWTKWIAYVYYGFGALCFNEFAGKIYDCPIQDGLTSGACKQYTGAYILASLGLPENWSRRPVLALLGFAIAFFILGIIILHILKREVQVSRSRNSNLDYSASQLHLTRRPINDLIGVTINLEGCVLDIEKKSILGRKEKKTIFKPVTATFEPGVLNVIMGPSGSGKTSLLNTMAQRLKNTVGTTCCTSGRTLFNGAVASKSAVRAVCSYVLQNDDGLLPSLTVRETIQFSARLRLPQSMSTDEKLQRAEAILLKLGLKDCADTMIGSELIRGISGGERRRVTIAVQILTDPRILFLDEPTSGLDAFTSSTILDVLQGLAEEGRTIVLTIHQPRSDLFKQFGNVLLMARAGSVIYSGRASQMLPYFESIGMKCPETTDPADFALDLVTDDFQEKSGDNFAEDQVHDMISTWKSGEPAANAGEGQSMTPTGLDALARKIPPFYTALPILIHRGITNLRRQPNLLTGRITQLLGLGIVVTVFFAPLSNDYYSVQSRMGYIVEISSMYFVGMLNSIAMYPNERAIFYSEDDDNIYPLEAFFLYYTIIEMPMELLASILFSLLTVLAVGLPHTASLYFLVSYSAFCVVSCGESLGIIFLTLFSHTGLAVSIMSVVLGISMHLGGVISLSVPGFLQAMNHLSPLKWQVGAMASYSMRGIVFTCTDAQRLADGRCPVETGEQVLRLYNLDVDTGIYAIALGAVTLGYRILVYLVLKARRTHWGDMF